MQTCIHTCIYVCILHMYIYIYIYVYICRHTLICIYIYMYIDITNLNALYTQRSKMLLNNDIQVQRPNTLHNKIQPTYFPFYSSQTIWSKPSACPVTLTPCCLRSLVKTFALSHASTRARPDSFMLKRFHSFVPTKKNKAHSQSNKPTSTVGSLKPPSSFDRTIHLYSAALSAEGVTVADRGYGERFITSCLWQGCPVPTPIRNVHLGQLPMRSAWHFVRGSKSKS